LRIETLESRVVLSAVPDVVLPADAVPSDMPAELTMMPADVASPRPVAEVARDVAYQTADGTVHVQPASRDTLVSIQQLINYRMQAVVEVSLGTTWQSFPAQSVTGVAIHAVDAQQPVHVAANVDMPVMLVEPGQTGRLLTEPSAAAIPASPLQEDLAGAAPFAAPPASSVVMGPLGEGEIGGGTPGGGSGPVDPDDPGDPGPPGPITGEPVIEGFAAQAEGGVWRFYGYVRDNDPVDGLIVALGGILAGRAAAVDFNGLFEVILFLGLNAKGIVTATAWDMDGLQSETVSLVIG
jgi:hypothetical protein